MLKLKIFAAMCLIVAVLIGSGCVTMEGLQKKYPGYTVVGKERKEIVEDAPVWLFSCVTPSGAVKCSVESVAACSDCYVNPGVSQCTVNCNTSRGDRWVKRQTGTKKVSLYQPILRLKSPTGQVVDEKVNQSMYNEAKEGQVFQDATKDYMAYYNLGLLYEKKKQYSDSKEAYKKAIEMNPSYANAMINLGIILEKEDKNFSEAENWFKKAIDTNPNNYLGYYNMGFLYSNKEFSKYDVDKAIGYYQKVISLKLDHDLSYFYIGNLYYHDKKEYPKAIATYEKAIQLYGKDPAYFNNLGLVYEAQKDYVKAEGYYRKSIAVDSSYGAAWESLGYALYYQRKDSEAKEAWKKAASLGRTGAKDALKKYYKITD